MSTIYSWTESEPVAAAVNTADSVLIYQSTTGMMAQAPVSTFRKQTVTAITSLTTATIGPGIATLSSLAVTQTLTAPTAGAHVTIAALIASTVARTINAGTGATFGSSFNLASSSGIQTLTLVGLSTTQWAVVANQPASTLTTNAMTFTTA